MLLSHEAPETYDLEARKVKTTSQELSTEETSSTFIRFVYEIVFRQICQRREVSGSEKATQ